MPSENDLEFDLFLEALEDYRAEKASFDEARSNCDYSWGYYGANHIEALDRARNTLREKLRNIIKAEVRAALAYPAADAVAHASPPPP